MTKLARALTFSLLLAALPLAVAAQDGDPAPSTDPSEDRAASFRAVDGAVSEDVPGGALLVGAYGAILVLLLGYVLWLGSLQAGANREIGRLSAALAKGTRATEKAAKKAKTSAKQASKAEAEPDEVAPKAAASKAPGESDAAADD